VSNSEQTELWWIADTLLNPRWQEINADASFGADPELTLARLLQITGKVDSDD
jgi:hypothetical protein